MMAATYLVVGALLVACLWITERQAQCERLTEKLRWYWRHDPRALKDYFDGQVDDLPDPWTERPD